MNSFQASLSKPVNQKLLPKFISRFSSIPIAFGVLLLGLILTGLAWNYTNRTTKQEIQAQFSREIDEGVISLNNRIQVYLNTFYAARGFWISENLDVKYEQWEHFVTSLDLHKRYPGINGLGFIRYVPNNKSAYEQRVRENNGNIEPIYQNYAVKPPGNRSDYFVIEYCEPIQRNQKAIGLDVGHEPIRRQAVEQARDSGQPAATGRIILVQDIQRTPGLLIYLPIYRLGMPVSTVEERRKAFFGFIYAPFRVVDLIEEGLSTSVKQHFDLVVYNHQDLMYGRADILTNNSGNSSLYHRKITINVAGKPWDLYFIQRANLNFNSRQNLPLFVLIIGIFSSLLLFGIVWSLAISYNKTKEAKEASDAAKEAADIANRSKSEFLANMSHELRTPLNAILGFTQILQRDSSMKAEQQESLAIINRSGEHLLSLINDVLDMSKIEAGRITLSANSFDLYRLLNTVEEMFQLKAQTKGIQIIVERHPEVPQYIQADESKLRQVLINLISNGIKFTQEGGVILRVEYQPEKLIFEVEDTGAGIAPEELENLFTAFVQTETGRKSQEGTGLGLPISKKFVQLMGGEILVNSEVGRGTIFHFDIKITQAQATEISLPKPTQRVMGIAPNQPPYRILVVDDRWENRRVLIHLLSSIGFQMREATNGQEAIEVWQTWEPHLIWMDMRMPVMDGYEATKRIKATTKGQATAIIALTASAFEEERNIVLAAGCDDFVRKPFREAVIFEKIAEKLGVKYIYEQKDEREQQVNPLPEKISIAQLQTIYLSQMDAEWIADLHQAAVELNLKKTLALIEQIPSEHDLLANVLKNWSNSFQFQNIVDLTKI